MPAKLPKKNGTIEVRLPDRAKTAFMERCRQEDRTASEAIRGFIDEQVAAGADVRPPRVPWRMLVAGIVGVGLGVGVAAPSLASSSPPTRAAFDRLDRNDDGALSYREFRLR